MPPIKTDDKVDAFFAGSQNWRSRKAISSLATLREMRDSGRVRLRVYSTSRKTFTDPRIRALSTRCAKRATIPTPFLPAFFWACRSGHLDDFPWRWFVHAGGSLTDGHVALFRARRVVADGESVGEMRWLRCVAFVGPRIWPRKRRATCRLAVDATHTSTPTTKAARERPRAVLLGSTNSWFSMSLSVLAIPQGKNQLAQLIEDGWTYFADAESEDEGNSS